MEKVYRWMDIRIDRQTDEVHYYKPRRWRVITKADCLYTGALGTDNRYGSGTVLVLGSGNVFGSGTVLFALVLFQSVLT